MLRQDLIDRFGLLIPEFVKYRVVNTVAVVLTHKETELMVIFKATAVINVMVDSTLINYPSEPHEEVTHEQVEQYHINYWNEYISAETKKMNNIKLLREKIC